LSDKIREESQINLQLIVKINSSWTPTQVCF